ncbi:leucine-rich repeat transmembrane neuronal protein 4-like [Nylanderia fulva]|uniref:leucine-rich repeat transmembrane neuronal protein 4-like n=1 Tax=Nylanderia fulva TaxID=613905 RepID=UPI0010FB3031|nr:leucine-rich repeat transmembrane neuronal protein 4-like [Nylanderia fulva]
MSIFHFNGFLLVCFVVATVPDVLVLGSPGVIFPESIGFPNPSSAKCFYNKARFLLVARCSGLKLKEIPLNLKPDIQVLDFTNNGVRTLENDSLYPYKKLVYIYLGDNKIRKIDEAAFANQHYLEVLELATNRIRALPESLFQMPNLHTLYLNDNLLTNSAFKMKVTSPIRLLQLDRNELTMIPKIGVQPTLLELNVSNNNITSISTEDLAPFCSLKVLDLSRNNISFNTDSCDCQRFIAWVKLRQIKIKPHNFYNCPKTPATLNEDCANVRFSDRTNELFDECLAIIQHEVETENARLFWMYVVSCISMFHFLLFVGLFCVHKQKKQLTANDDNIEMRQQEPANN